MKHLELDEAKSSADRIAFRVVVRRPGTAFESGFRRLANDNVELQNFRPEIGDSMLYLNATVTPEELEALDAFVASVERQYEEHIAKLRHQQGM